MGMHRNRVEVQASGEANCGGPRGGSPADWRSRPGDRLRGVPILVVEDDPPSAKLVALLLGQHGCVVRIATNAEDALKALEEFRPRLIVLDLVLPRMGGLLFAHHIKSDPRFCDTVIVAATVINGADVERIVRETGCAGYIRKPIDTETFAATLADCLKEKS